MTMEIPEVAHNHPQRVYVVRTSFWAGHSNWEETPLPQEVEMEERLWNTLEKLQVISEA